MPIDALQWSQGDDKEAVLNMEPAQIRNGAGFDEDRLDNLNDPEFKRSVQEQIGRSGQGRSQ